MEEAIKNGGDQKKRQWSGVHEHDPVELLSSSEVF